MASKFVSTFQKLIATSLTLGIIGYLLPAQAVTYGAKNELLSLEISLDSCVERAFRAVSAVATSNIRDNNRGYSGIVGESMEVTISVNCTSLGSYSAVNISVVYVENGAAIADSVRDRLIDKFFEN